MAAGQTSSPASHADIRPSSEDRCAECGELVGREWAFYREDPGDPKKILKHISGIVKAGPVEPKSDHPKRPIRDLRCPEDLGVFFHSGCAPRAQLPKEVLELLAKLLAANYEKTLVRWAMVRQSLPGEGNPLRCQAYVASANGRRVFTMAQAQWEQLKAHEGRLVEIDLERVPTGLAEAASVIAGLAAECHVESGLIEVWPYNEQDPPAPLNVQRYLIIDNLTPRRLNLQKFAERASTQDSPDLQKYLRDHVFIVKVQPERGRWEPKGRAIERIVFMAIKTEP